MEKIGKRASFCFFIGLLISVFFLEAAAQDNLSVEATVSEAVTYTGDILQLNISISGHFNKISRPDLSRVEGFALMNTVPSTSRHFSYINGVSKTSYTYSYYLRAQKKGTFSIPSVSISIDGKKYVTNPITVKVIDRSNAAKNDSSRPGVFLRMEVSDRTVVPGRQIIANVILYFKDNMQVNSYQPIPGWKAEGFWKERLESSRRPKVKSTIINGVRYNKAQLLQFALFPTKTGELTISPYHVKIVARAISDRRSPFSSFFGSFGADRRRLELETEPVTIEVKPLPDTTGAKYIGAVGSFYIDRKISADSVQVGETIEIITTISGTGNIPLLTKPEYDLPSGLEIYQPKVDVQINRRGARIKGSKIFTDIVVPRNQGTVTIPKVTLSYYSPDQNKFIEETLPAKTITVRANAAGNTDNNIGRITLSPVTGLVNWASPRQKKLITYWWFWAGLVLPLLGIAVGYWRKTFVEKMNSSYIFARSQKADDIAEKRLQQAIEYSEDEQLKKAYNSLQKALTGFISDKLGMPEAGLSVEQYVEALEERNVNRDLIKNVRMLLNKCATINYAPDTSSAHLKSHVGLAESIMKKLKREL